MSRPARNLRYTRRINSQQRRGAIALAFCLAAPGATANASSAEPGPDEPLRVAVYDVAPYGSAGADGLFSGASVDLWRRVAEELRLPYRFTLVPQMDAVLGGLEHGRFDAAIGAITITPERLARVEFSYPAHRSGEAVAVLRDTGFMASLKSYGAVVKELGSLIVVILALLLLIGLLMWAFERPRRNATDRSDSSVTTLHEGIYWAVVTITTVGYGDKTPKTLLGRAVAVLWMLGSLALISLLTTSLVSRMTAERVEASPIARNSDLEGKRLATVAASSGAEYLDGLHIRYEKYPNLREALAAVASGRSDAVVNGVGALQYAISTHFSGVIVMLQGLLAPASMAFALPPGSPLKKPLDRALIKVTESPEWRSLEESYFGK
jgi:ABC-type amino acid transport substrate-binding protein